MLGDAIENPLAQVGVCHLPTPEHDGDLHLVALVEEMGDLAGLGVEVAASDLGAVLHLLDLHVAGLAPGLLVALGCLVLPFAVVEDLAHRRVGHGGYLDQVEVELPGDVKCFGQGFDAELAPVRIDQAHLSGPDAIVDPKLVVDRCGYAASLQTRNRRTLESNVRPLLTSTAMAVIRPGRTCDRGRVGAHDPAFLFCVCT